MIKGFQSLGDFVLVIIIASLSKCVCVCVCVCVCTRASQVTLVVKNPPANAGDLRDTGSIPGLGGSPGGGHGNPLQCSCLEDPVDRGARRARSMRSHRLAQHNTCSTNGSK